MQSESERFIGMDGLRSFSMFFIVYWHCLLPFTATVNWYVKNNVLSETFELIGLLLSGFTLRVFFVLAGFFSMHLYGRYGMAGFVKHRLVRIAIPLVVALFTYNFFLYEFWVNTGNSTIPLDKPAAFFETAGAIAGEPPTWYLIPNTMHLWFMVYLAAVIAIFVGLQGVHRTCQRSSAVKLLVGFITRNSMRPLSFLVYVSITAIILIAHGGVPLDPSFINTPIHLAPDLLLLGYWLLFFLFGCALYLNKQFINSLSRLCYWLLLLGIATKLIHTYMLFAFDEQSAVLLCVLASINSWSMMLSLIGLFSRHLTKDSYLIRYLSDSSYWCYLVHFIPLFFIQAYLYSLELPVFFKYLLLCFIVSMVSLLSYHLLVRRSVVGRLLNGSRVVEVC